MYKISFDDFDIKLSESKFHKFLLGHLFYLNDGKYKKRIKNYGFEIENDIYYDFIIEYKNNEYHFYFQLENDIKEYSIIQSFDFYMQILIKKFIIQEKGFYVNDIELFNFILNGNSYTLTETWKLIDIDVMKNQVILINKITHIKIVLELKRIYLEYFYYYFDRLKNLSIQYIDNTIVVSK